MDQTSLTRLIVTRRTNDLTDNIKETLKERLKSCAAISLTLEESTDISDTALLVIFIRPVTVDLDVVEELLEVTSLSSTGQDVCEHVIRVVENRILPNCVVLQQMALPP